MNSDELEAEAARIIAEAQTMPFDAMMRHIRSAVRDRMELVATTAMDRWMTDNIDAIKAWLEANRNELSG